MSAGRGDPNTPGNRPLFQSAGVPNLGCHNLAAPAAAGNTGSIASQVLLSPCSTSVLNTIQEVSAPQSAQLSPISRATEQDDVPCIQPSWNMPRGCTQVPINIIVFHRQLAGRGSRAQLPPSATTALPDVSEGASIRLAGSNFLSLGRTSNVIAGDMTTNSSQLATPDKYNSEHLRPNCLYDEASKTDNGIETSQLPQLATAIFRDSYNDLESVIPAATWETRVQHSQESTTLLAESTTDDNIHMYQSMQKRLKTQINQSEHTPLSTPTVPKEKTLTQIEMQIASAEKTEMFRNEETLPLKMKARKKKYRPKVIRENKLAKVQKPDSTPDGKSPNQKVKRSYVRKKRNLSSLENCSGPVSDQSISRATGVAARSRTASVRRSLQFESKEQGLQGGHSSMTNSHHHKPKQEVSTATSGSFSTELAREEDNLGRTCKPDGKSKCSLFTEERVVKPITEGNKKDLELNYSDADGFISSARSLPEMEPTGSQMGKVSEVENPTHHRNGSLPGTRDSVVSRTAAEMLTIFHSGAMKKQRSARLRRNSLFSIMDPENNTLQASNALVPYGGAVMVPDERPLQLVIKKQRPRAKVVLDFETTKVCNLLMGKSAEPDGTDVEKERWWQQEREVFQGRANSFIACMRFVQGDRCFSPWKGSVVDSVVGVFFTQNVGDHLSSSAYMALAASFPSRSVNSNCKDDATTDDNEQTPSTSALVGEKSVFGLFYNGARPDREVGYEEVSMTCKKTYMEPKETYSKPKKTRTTTKKNAENFDWDKLRRQACNEGQMKKRSFERRDSVDWEAVRCADVQRISHAIRERGMNNILAERIQNFLNRLVRDHGSIDLEWLRHVPPDLVKDFLLSIHGLGLKSVECIRLLTLHHLAFPVDTNVGRICVRLGWVPIQPLPESLQLHLLELYPMLENIQKYLWPRLCKLNQQTLYELHYQMITFGKVFCTKSKPNCNACPMKSECKHFASAFASARLALPAPLEKSLVQSSNQFAFQNSSMHTMNSTHLPRLEGSIHAREFLPNNSEPIIEEPASPKEEGPPETMENDFEDFYEDGEIQTIKLNMEAFAQNLENCIKESNNELQSDDIAKALVAINTEAASIPVPKLKNVHRLRTEHCVYELPDAHPLLQMLGLDQREPNDPTPYLLAIRTPDGIKEITKTPKPCCDPQMGGDLCNNEMCHNCTAEEENQSGYVRGTILVPCRTAMRGSFPLNGTYFQVNEVFADHRSSHNPIRVEREQLWNLQRRMVFFGTSVPTIFKGLTTQQIQECFWRGFVCVRGFDMETRAPRPLCPHLHVVARPYARKTAATEQVL